MKMKIADMLIRGISCLAIIFAGISLGMEFAMAIAGFSINLALVVADIFLLIFVTSWCIIKGGDE